MARNLVEAVAADADRVRLAQRALSLLQVWKARHESPLVRRSPLELPLPVLRLLLGRHRPERPRESRGLIAAHDGPQTRVIARIREPLRWARVQVTVLRSTETRAVLFVQSARILNGRAFRAAR